MHWKSTEQTQDIDTRMDGTVNQVNRHGSRKLIRRGRRQVLLKNSFGFNRFEIVIHSLSHGVLPISKAV